jgi:hypothetical protein
MSTDDGFSLESAAHEVADDFAVDLTSGTEGIGKMKLNSFSRTGQMRDQVMVGVNRCERPDGVSP